MLSRGDIIILVEDIGEYKKGTMGRVKEIYSSVISSGIFPRSGLVTAAMSRAGKIYYLTLSGGKEIQISLVSEWSKIRKVTKQERFLFEMSGDEIIIDGLC